MRLVPILGVLVVVLSSGCDPATGVIRSVKLPTMPSQQAVEDALRDVPEAKNFSHDAQRSPDTWETRNGMLTLELRKTRNGEAVLEMRYLHFGTSTLAELDRPRRLMDEVYASLRNRTASLPSPTNVTEKLIRVRTK
jgi:hypothetical protein